jgi:tetratricopeptide (TPR) repeat protein
MFTGDFPQGQAIGEEAFQVGRSSNNIEAQSNSRSMIAWSYAEQGDFKRAQEMMAEAVALGEASGNVSVMMFTRSDLGLTYALLGAFDKGILLAQAALATAEAGIPIMAGWPGGILTRLYLLKGDLHSAEEVAQRLKPSAVYKQQTRFMVPLWAHVGIAEVELALASGDLAAAMTGANRLISDLRMDGVKLFLADALYTKGRVLVGQNSLESARAAFLEGCAAAEQIGSQQTLWPIVSALSELERELGNLEKARTLLAQAAKIVRSVADHAPSPELRDSFLTLPRTQKVLAG